MFAPYFRRKRRSGQEFSGGTLHGKRPEGDGDGVGMGVSSPDMPRRLFLPLAAPVSRKPTVDAVRKRLGGRASTEAGAGEVVGLRDACSGVVLFVRGEQLDVWLDGDVVRRVRRADTCPAGEGAPRDLLSVARDARTFAELREGQRVAFVHEGGTGEGALVEKCRFGGLVERADGTVVGVGFRRLMAAPRPPGEGRPS